MKQISVKRILTIKILKVISLIPLIIYPIILLANLMSLVGHRSRDESVILILSSYAFLIFSTLYPLTLLYSLIYNREKKIFIAFLPIFHLTLSVILCFVWMNAE